MLKTWYEDKIKNKEIKDKIAIVLTVNNEEIFWPLNNENVLNKINDMFNGDYCFSADELPAIRSDDDTQINISWIDKFKFIILSEYQRKVGQRTHNPSAFFEYRLIDDYSEFEEILTKYQIFTHLDNDNHKTFRDELKHNWLIYAISSKISDQDTLAKMSNYFLNISHIPTNMLSDFCKTFNINIVLYSYDNKGHIIKMNKKNG